MVEEDKSSSNDEKEEYVDVFADDDEVDEDTTKPDEPHTEEKEDTQTKESATTNLVLTYYHEMASELNGLVRDIISSLEKPLTVESIVLCRHEDLTQISDGIYVIRDVPGAWADTGFTATNAYEAYRHAQVYVQQLGGAAIVLKGKKYVVLSKTKIPAKFVYAGRSAMVI